jgi:hypothetical protein
VFVAAEREALGYDLARFDLDVPAVEVDGERYHRVLRCATTYTSAVGPMRIERSLYRHPHDEHAVCPLELRAGIIEGSWTPLAAQQATWVVAPLPPQEGEELFDLLGNMTPSKSTLARLPHALSVHWENQRPHFEATLRRQEALPNEAVAMAVSLDGVMAPMKDGQRDAKRAQARAEGKAPSGPAGYQEVGCATISYDDRHGERLCTRRMARMPEPQKATLQRQLTAEVMGALSQRPFTGGQSGRWCAGQLELSGRDPAVWGRGARFFSRHGASRHGAGSGLWGRNPPIPSTLGDVAYRPP